LVAPYQLQRRPRRPIEENCLEFARAMAQNVAEIRALTGWLLGEGCPSVALLGFSFGGIEGIHVRGSASDRGVLAKVAAAGILAIASRSC
jgi:hypothetical protein